MLAYLPVIIDGPHYVHFLCRYANSAWKIKWKQGHRRVTVILRCSARKKSCIWITSGGTRRFDIVCGEHIKDATVKVRILPVEPHQTIESNSEWRVTTDRIVVLAVPRVRSLGGRDVPALERFDLRFEGINLIKVIYYGPLLVGMNADRP